MQPLGAIVGAVIGGVIGAIWLAEMAKTETGKVESVAEDDEEWHAREIRLLERALARARKDGREARAELRRLIPHLDNPETLDADVDAWDEEDQEEWEATQAEDDEEEL